MLWSVAVLVGTPDYTSRATGTVRPRYREDAVRPRYREDEPRPPGRKEDWKGTGKAATVLLTHESL